jgi:HK97 family phage prohead protease
MSKTIKKQLPMGYLRTQTAINQTVNEETRTVDLTWSTGFKGLRAGWDGTYYEELSMDPKHVDMTRLQARAPLLAAHNAYDLNAVIGVVERASIENGVGVATVRFSKDPEADKIFQKVREGILTGVSVGYQVRKYEDVTQKGEATPTYRATNWQPHEISIVPIGFDPNAQIRATENKNEVEIEIQNTNENNTEALDNRHLDKLNGDITMSDTPVKPQLSSEEIDKAIKQAAQEEKQRQLEIRQAVRSAKLEDTFADELCKEEITVEQACKRVLAKLASQQPEPPKSNVTVEIGTDEKDKKRQAAAEALLARVDSASFKPKEGNGFNHQSLLRIMESFVGYRPGMSQTEIVSRAMSSSDLPYILANVAEKSAQQKYQIQPRTWSRWARKDSLRNFKTHDKVRSGDFSSLDERQESGEFKRGKFSEEREQVALKEFGKIMAFTRKMLINDDLSEIQKVIAQGGAAAARLENRLVYEVLSSNPNMGDGNPLFDASHDNLGTGAALSDTTIGEAFQLMREQTSVDGLEKLNLAPKYLICGPQNEVLARKYMAVISPTQASNVNVFSNSLELIVDSEISTNDYFFAADQNLIPTVTLYYLEGEESPRIESRTDFETESVEIKVAHSCVAKADDWRGLVKNANGS